MTGVQTCALPILSMIKSKSLEWWINLHNLFYYFGVEIKNDALAYAIERVWPLIWEYEENESK